MDAQVKTADKKVAKLAHDMAVAKVKLEKERVLAVQRTETRLESLISNGEALTL